MRLSCRFKFKRSHRVRDGLVAARKEREDIYYHSSSSGMFTVHTATQGPKNSTISLRNLLQQKAVPHYDVFMKSYRSVITQRPYQQQKE